MGRSRSRKPNQPRKTRLDRMIEEAIVDAYGESEQLVGLYTMIESNLSLPFETMVLGVPVMVVRVDLTQRDEIVAVCRRAGVRQIVRVPLCPRHGACGGAATRSRCLTQDQQQCREKPGGPMPGD